MILSNMEFRTKLYCYFLSFTLLLPAFCFPDDAYVSTRATYYGSRYSRGISTGACGYGEYGRTVNNGQVSGVSRLYRNGGGCGACYQVRCKNASLCTEEGATVVATDYGEVRNTDFILSFRAYIKLASKNQAVPLFSAGIIAVEYKRVPCKYQANLLVKVNEKSRFPDYLSIVFLNQGGMYDITAVEVSEESSGDWTAMRRAYGAVWDTESPPEGELAFKLQVSGNAEVKWVEPTGVLPSEWKAGVSYDTSYQFS